MVVHLPEIRSGKLFRRYLSWVRDDVANVFPEEEHYNTSVLIRFYLLGDFLDDVRLRNVTIQLLTGYGICPTIRECNRVFRKTGPNSPLRKWAVDAIISLADGDTFERLSVLYDVDLTLQIATTLMHQRPSAVVIENDLSEGMAKNYATTLWDFAMSSNDEQLRALIVHKFAYGLDVNTFEKAATWPAKLTLQLACELMHMRPHNGTDVVGLVGRTQSYMEATTASDFDDV